MMSLKGDKNKTTLVQLKSFSVICLNHLEFRDYPLCLTDEKILSVRMNDKLNISGLLDLIPLLELSLQKSLYMYAG